MAARSQRNRREILRVARDLLIEKGEEEFSLREVARRVGYTPGALYTYFSGKDDLLAQVAIEGLDILGGYLTDVDEKLPPAERLVEMGIAYLTFARDHPEYFALVFDRLTVPAESWTHLTEVAWPFTLFIDTFWEGVEEGSLRERHGLAPDAMAYGLWALSQGMCSLRRHHLAAVTDDLLSMDRAAIHAYVGVFRADRTPPRREP